MLDSRANVPSHDYFQSRDLEEGKAPDSQVESFQILTDRQSAHSLDDIKTDVDKIPKVAMADEEEKSHEKRVEDCGGARRKGWEGVHDNGDGDDEANQSSGEDDGDDKESGECDNGDKKEKNGGADYANVE